MKRPSPSLVISLIALFVALGGTGYAATQLPKNSVGPRQIKKGAVTTEKISRATRKALTGKVGATGAIGATGAAGPTGAAGAAGAQGPQGIQGVQGDKGAPGTAKAFGLIDSTGTVSLGQGITSANVQKIGAGAYCIFGLNFTPQNAIATIETIATGDTISTGITGGGTACPDGTQVRAFVFDKNDLASDHSFFLLLN